MCRTTRTAICHSRRRRICSGASRRRGASNCAVMVVSICYFLWCAFFICWFVAGTRWCGHCVLTVLTVSARSGSTRTPAHARCTSRSATRRCEEQHCRAAPRRAAPHDACNERCKCVRHSGCGSRCAPILRWGAARTHVARALPCSLLCSLLPQCCLCYR